MAFFDIYARESSDDTTKAPDIGNQIERGKAWGVENNHTLNNVYSDNGYSGGTDERPDFKRLIAAAPTTTSRFLWTFDQDRIARHVGIFRSFYDVMHTHGIQIFTGTQGEIKMESIGDYANFTAQSFGAELFRKSISEKVRATYQAKKKAAEARGEVLKWGAHKIPQSTIDLCIQMKRENPSMGCRQIAAALPLHTLVQRKDEKEPRVRKISHVWVAQVLKNAPSVNS